MKIIYTGLTVLSLILFSGCSSRGMMTSNHNGKMYWNPGNCSQYRYYYNDPDTLRCLKDGQETGVVLRPADQEQVNNYYREQEENQRALDSLNRSLRTVGNSLNQSADQTYKAADSLRQMNNQMYQEQQNRKTNYQLQQINNNLKEIRYRY